jgi:hypothetical protein
MSLSNCFQIDDNEKTKSWADCCDEEDDFILPSLPKLKVKSVVKHKHVEQVEPVVKKKVENPFSVLNSDSEDEDNLVQEISSMYVKGDDEEDIQPDIVEEYGWKTIKTSKKGKQIIINEGDIIIVCKMCKKDFLFTLDEADYFSSKGWPSRTKCKPCKHEQKLNENFGGMPRVNRKKTINN